MDSCLLCLEFDTNAIRADSKKWEELNIKQIVEKHFWPLDSLQNSSCVCVCLTCWEEVNSFHKFYKRIDEAHTNNKINNFEYCFQEPEILLQQTESTTFTFKEKLPSLEEPPLNVKVESNNFRQENNVDTEDPLEKCKNRSTDQKVEEVSEIKKETNDLDEGNEQIDDSCYNICDETSITDPYSLVKKGETEKSSSSDSQRIKREENDKFIVKHLKKIVCDLCQASFKDFPTLQKHFTEVHKQRGYIVCCNRKFRSRTGLIDHLLCHINPDYYKCKECGKSMSERMSFKNHMLRVHRANEVVKKHSCDICGKAFIKAYVLRDHLLTHLSEEEKKFPCKECGKKYASAYILNQHQQAVHLKRFAKICDVCGKCFNSNVELKAHINRHEGIPAPVLTCDICGLLLTTAKGLKLHKINQHPVGGKQDHPCPICAKVSPNLTALRKHIYRMHGKGYEYKCTICEKAFKRSETLKEHIAAHTGTALYTCQWCPMTFNSNGNMYAHRKRMHPKEWEETQLQKYATNIS